jgi:hypothetical protein
MTNLLTKRAMTAVVALGIAAGATGFAPPTAFAATHAHKATVAHVHKAASTHARKATAVACTKATVSKTKKADKATWVCEKSGKSYKWAKLAKLAKKTKK